MELTYNLQKNIVKLISDKTSYIYNNVNVIIRDSVSIDYPNLSFLIKDYIDSLPVYTLSDLGLGNSNINVTFSTKIYNPYVVVNLTTESNISNSKFLGIVEQNDSNSFVGTVFLKDWYT